MCASLHSYSRFGIMNTDVNNRIVEFEENQKTKSTKATMGMRAFDWQRLRNMLVAEKSNVDMSDLVRMLSLTTLNLAKAFMLMTCRLLKDVGTESLLEANMEYISSEMPTAAIIAGKFILAT